MQGRQVTSSLVEYNPSQIEVKWQQKWEEDSLFQNTANNIDPKKEKLFLLFAFAYPSGSGLHVGHVESKTALDILARFYRMRGKQVFFPVGWDAFGLPAENYAIKTGIHPEQTTKQAINTFRTQIKRLGISYDWSTELATCHPKYYRWTQWLFSQLYKAGLAYQGTGSVNWCPSCKTVLANEQVVDGRCERCGADVVQREMKQWFFKITQYKEELIAGLDQVDWPASTKQQQLFWIGKREGVEIDFEIFSEDKSKINSKFIKCFTTRVDTIFGVTFLAISPEKFLELKLIDLIKSDNHNKVEQYIELSKKKTEEERKIGEKDKTGVNTGLTVINPVNNERIPIFVADYVLSGYGTGAVMGVPAHDSRDFQFATKFDCKIKRVIKLPNEKIADGESNDDSSLIVDYGILINSGRFNNLSSEEAQDIIPASFSKQIRKTINFKLRDWLISRQRYWGAPIPIIYDPDGGVHLIDAQDLPWVLPTDVDFQPTGESPLATSIELLTRTEQYAAQHYSDLIELKSWDKNGKGWRPEYDTMDTFVDSSWYYLRYGDVNNNLVFANSSQLKHWLPVDFYMIGPEHIVLHLLYSRFFTKFLRDQGYLQFDEPFMKMRHQGMILGPDGQKMSKSKGNVISPDEIIDKFGSDTLRVYEMFMGPIESDKPWDVRAVIGIYKFLKRLHRLVASNIYKFTEIQDQSPQNKLDEANYDLTKKLHKTIDKVSKDIPYLKFNTSIALLMELVNTWDDHRDSGRFFDKLNLENLVLILAPFAPFLAEELYSMMGYKNSIHFQSWPVANQRYLVDEVVNLPIQINGKMRAQVKIAKDELQDESRVVAKVERDPSLEKWLKDKTIERIIYIPERILNLIVT